MWPLPFRFRHRVLSLTLVIAILSQKCLAIFPVCRSEECKKLGQFYTKNMNKIVDPCTDFYQFACSGWEEEHSQKMYSTYSVEKYMKETAYEKLKLAIEAKEPSHVREIEQAKELYKICTNSPSLGRMDPPPLRNIMTGMVHAFPMLLPKNKDSSLSLPSWSLDYQYVKLTGESALFDFSVITNTSDRSKIVSVISPIVSPYAVFTRTTDWTVAKELEHYKSFLNLIVKAVAPPKLKPSKDVLTQDIDDVIQFREQLRKIAKLSSSDKTSDMTITQLQTWYDGEVKKKPLAQFNWLEEIRVMYKVPKSGSSFKISTVSMVKVKKQYLSRLATLLSKTKKRVVVNHIHLYFVEKHLKLNSAMIEEMKQSFYDGYAKTGKYLIDKERWRKCLENHNMRASIVKLYLKAQFPPKYEEDVSALMEKAKHLLTQDIASSNWISTEAKKHSIAKVKNVSSVIGYPSWYKLTTMAPRYVHDDIYPLEVDAYYEPEENRLSVSAAYLQFPYFGMNLPYAVDYGSIMTMFGHELYHGFDSVGITYSSRGKTPWWPQAMVDQHKDHTKCFKNQYKTLLQHAFRQHNIPYSMETHSLDTSDEDMADVMGLKLAYKGFKQKIRENKNICPVVPGFEDFGCEKLFFIAFANTFCTYITPGYYEKILTKDDHSPPDIRVNAALANLPEFGALFKCKDYSPLRKSKPCDLWRY